MRDEVAIGKAERISREKERPKERATIQGTLHDHSSRPHYVASWGLTPITNHRITVLTRIVLR